jgi:ATP-dependent protease ClpP protease subunit
MTLETLTVDHFANPAILLAGPVDYGMYDRFRQQLDQAGREGVTVVTLTTLGGDPEVARMMGEDVRFHSHINPGIRLVFLGKTAVYSAGATLMSFFCKENRYLTRGTRIMIHERQHSGDLKLEGALSSCAKTLRGKLAEIEESMVIQQEGFANLAAGSSLSAEEIAEKAVENWYIEATDAQRLGLVETVI